MARKRRRQSLKDWAARLQVSVPTLMRMEKGDPTVSMGVYATALWMINRQGALAAAAEPKEDLGALEAEIREAEQRHRPQGRRAVTEVPRTSPAHTLFLWWLGVPGAAASGWRAPAGGRGPGSRLQYGPAWLAAGFPLSEDLPCVRTCSCPREGQAAGAVDDARPDRWGERVIRNSSDRRGCRSWSTCCSPARPPRRAWRERGGGCLCALAGGAAAGPGDLPAMRRWCAR